MEATIEKKKEQLDKTNALVKELKPAKQRAVKYEYPEGLTAGEKKKYRTKMRAEERKANGTAKPKKEKKAKKVKAEKPAKAEKGSKTKTAKKGKKAKASKED